SDSFGIKRQTREILAEPVDPRPRAIDCCHVCACEGELCGLPARRGAQVGHVHSAKVTEKPDPQRGRGGLYPPGPFGESRQQRDRAMCERAYGTGRYDATAQPLGPGLGVLLHREIAGTLVTA